MPPNKKKIEPKCVKPDMLRYQNVVIELSGDGGTRIVPAPKAKLSQSATVAPRRTLQTGSMVDGWGVGGSPDYQLSFDFPVVAGLAITPYDAWGYLTDLTGDSSFSVAIGKTVYNTCFLENMALSIAPNSPIMASATIRMFADGSVTNPPTGDSYSISDFHSKIAYGHNVITGDLGSRADQNIAAISYAIDCQRSYSFPIWSASNNTGERVVGFLDSVDKKMTIENRNTDDILPYSGFSGGFYVMMTGNGGPSVLIGVSGESLIQSISHDYEAGRNGASSISLSEAVY